MNDGVGGGIDMDFLSAPANPAPPAPQPQQQQQQQNVVELQDIGGSAAIASIIKEVDEMEDDDDHSGIGDFNNLDRWSTGADNMEFRVGRAISGFIKDLSVKDVQIEREDASVTLGSIQEEPSSVTARQLPSQNSSSSRSSAMSFWDIFAKPAAAVAPSPPANDDQSSVGQTRESVGTSAVDSQTPLQKEEPSLWRNSIEGATRQASNLNVLWESEDGDISKKKDLRKKRACAVIIWAVLMMALLTVSAITTWWGNLRAAHHAHKGTQSGGFPDSGDYFTYSTDDMVAQPGSPPDAGLSPYNKPRDIPGVGSMEAQGVEEEEVEIEHKNRNEIFDLLTSISPNLSKNQRDTPQYKAFEWIVGQDLPISNYRIVQRFVLASLYYSSNGDQWDMSTGGHNVAWMSEENECMWYGVRCLNFETMILTESVSVISLPRSELKGRIPPEIGELPLLEILKLNDNAISGFIPESIVTLSNLRELHLQRNQLSGRIPNYIGNLRNIEKLDLSNNNLIGSIPSGLNRWKSIDSINLGRNYLSGAFPRQLKELRTLEQLTLSENKLTGELPDWLGDLQALKVLSLNHNRFWGSIPDRIGLLNDLNTLSVAANSLTGSIPDGLGRLIDLNIVDLSQNKLTGAIPHTLVNCEKLQVINLHDNLLRGPVPNWFGASSPLDHLTLHTNQLRGTVPARLCMAEMKVATSDCRGDDAPVRCDCCTFCGEGVV